MEFFYFRSIPVHRIMHCFFPRRTRVEEKKKKTRTVNDLLRALVCLVQGTLPLTYLVMTWRWMYIFFLPVNEGFLHWMAYKQWWGVHEIFKEKPPKMTPRLIYYYLVDGSAPSSSSVATLLRLCNQIVRTSGRINSVSVNGWHASLLLSEGNHTKATL